MITSPIIQRNRGAGPVPPAPPVVFQGPPRLDFVRAVTVAEINALLTTPVFLMPAPGPKRVIRVLNYFLECRQGAQVWSINPSIRLAYGNGVLLLNGVNTINSINLYSIGLEARRVAGVTVGDTHIDNQPLFMESALGVGIGFGAGSRLRLTIEYTILNIMG